MSPNAYAGMELRKLPPKFRLKIAQLLDVHDAWKKLMSHIPSEKNSELSKYTMEHMDMIERHARQMRKYCGEILLDEWSTSGKQRPVVETLLNLLIDCQLYRAADFVATEILGTSAPERPLEGPAARVNLEDVNELSTVLDQTIRIGDTEQLRAFDQMLEHLNNQDYQTGKIINFGIEIMEKATNHFSDDLVVGKGAFGTVYRLDLSVKGGPALAVKVLRPTSSVVEGQFVNEIQALSKYRHENLVSLIGFSTNSIQNVCLVFEFMNGGSLLDALACSFGEPLSWPRRVRIMFGVAKGISYLHSAQQQPLIHRDIKSANVLLDTDLNPKIGDFGLAKTFSNSNQTSALTSTIFGTSAYMAPEAFRGDLSPKMDVFSFGVVLLELLTGLSPFDESREGHDIVTYLEEVVEDDDIMPLLDQKASDLDTNQASFVYSLSLKCLSDKRSRPTSDVVKDSLEPLIVSKVWL